MPARTEEIIFTRNATEAINLVAYTFGRERIKAGDEIVLSIMEHHSNIVPWHFLRERQGAVIKWAPVDDEGNFLIDEFEKLLSPRTKMVAITHMSNMLGTVVPVKEVVRLAHAPRHSGAGRRRAGAPCISTSTSQDIGCDFYAFTGHKLYGPTGIGVLYGKHEHLAAMPPFNGGGEMIREVFEDRVTYGEPPHRFEAGTPPIVQAIGLGRRHRLCQLDRQGAHPGARAGLVAYAHERLREINSLRIFGTARDKGPIVSFEIKGAHPHDVATIIDRSGIAVRAGTHCVMPLLARFGVTATCRASFGLYNTRAEVDGLARSPDQGAGFLRMTDDAEPVPEATAAPSAEPAPAPGAGDAVRAAGRRVARLTDDDHRRAQDRLRSGNPVRHLRARPDLQDRHRRRSRGGDRDDAHHAQLSLGAGTADHGGERGGERPGRRRGQGQYRVGSALGPEPDVGRSPRHSQYVVRREARPRDRDQPLRRRSRPCGQVLRAGAGACRR